MVTFNESEPSSSSMMDSETNEYSLQEIDAKYGKPSLEPDFSYKVVGRLSRWEGGNTTPYQVEEKEPETNVQIDHGGTEKMSFCAFIKQFFRPCYDLTEVTIEDISRVKIMHDRFMGDAQFSFNYSTLLVIASVIAGVGLGGDSSASVIASMLVSP
ncbi:unnamed protein product [Pseudo-nitzschia multistriata]|uniref:Uncharacterized protein n=1 Tax=Pseudo-nitzschia multistriata TaxID=183589 RepID=A0A448Z2K6_9STRA|nr:unnamed protein product [Pseudo-nitzschia multistriata]